jgi:hypothetical protein
MPWEVSMTKIEKWALVVLIPAALIGAAWIKWNEIIYSWADTIRWAWMGYTISVAYSFISLLAAVAVALSCIALGIFGGPEDES